MSIIIKIKKTSPSWDTLLQKFKENISSKYFFDAKKNLKQKCAKKFAIRVTIHYATLRANIYSNRWHEPIRNAQPLSSAFDRFPPTVACKWLHRKLLRTLFFFYSVFWCIPMGLKFL